MFLALDGIQRKKHEINPFLACIRRLADHDKKILLKKNN
jgi:hypothetical protein